MFITLTSTTDTDCLGNVTTLVLASRASRLASHLKRLEAAAGSWPVGQVRYRPCFLDKVGHELVPSAEDHYACAAIQSN